MKPTHEENSILGIEHAECRQPVRTSLPFSPFEVKRKPYTSERRSEALSEDNLISGDNDTLYQVGFEGTRRGTMQQEVSNTPPPSPLIPATFSGPLGIVKQRGGDPLVGPSLPTFVLKTGQLSLSSSPGRSMERYFFVFCCLFLSMT